MSADESSPPAVKPFAAAIATVAFVAMTPIGWLSFRFVESPFLRLRKPYLR
mgnify:CR=1 FL=1